MTRCRMAVALATVALATGCARPSEPEAWDVVLVLVDTLRADHMSLYGYERPTTPFLDELAGESVVFERVQSQAGCTFPSVASILTSRYPAEHIREGQALPDTMTPLAEILGDRGWATAAVSSSPVIRQTEPWVRIDGAYGRGFDRFVETVPWVNAGRVVHQARRLIDTTEGPMFLFLHMTDPHQPYSPPADHERVFAVEEPDEAFVRRGRIHKLVSMLYEDGPEVELSDGDLEHLLALYDEEILYVDGQIRALVDTLMEAGRWDRTVLVVLSDHGEEFLEHGHVSHCRNLVWSTIVETPLLIRAPGLGPARVEGLTQNLDVVPTLVDLLGLDVDLPFDGRSLRPAIEAAGPANRYQFTAQGRARAVSDGDFKLIYDHKTGVTTLFDRQSDPLELTDVSAEHPDVAERLSRVLFGWIEEYEGPNAAEIASQRAAELQEQLDAVGYF